MHLLRRLNEYWETLTNSKQLVYGVVGGGGLIALAGAASVIIQEAWQSRAHTERVERLQRWHGSTVAIRAAFKSLESTSGPQGTEPIDALRTAWVLDTAYDGEAIARAVKDPLVIGTDTIQQRIYPDVSNLAQPFCENGQRTIVFDQRMTPQLSYEAYLYIRSHEYEHFALSHFVCPGGAKKDTWSEREADCEATRYLMGRGVEGISAIQAFIDKLGTLPPNAMPGYGTPAERRTFIRSCRDNPA